MAVHKSATTEDVLAEQMPEPRSVNTKRCAWSALEWLQDLDLCGAELVQATSGINKVDRASMFGRRSPGPQRAASTLVM
jgi:hypothetical protein